MITNKDQKEFQEKLLTLCEDYGATITSEGEDGVFVDFSKGEADAFYFQQADSTGFDT